MLAVKNFCLQKQILLLRFVYYLIKVYGNTLAFLTLSKYNVEIGLKDARSLIWILTQFKNTFFTRFDSLSELTAIDTPSRKFRFKVVYLCVATFYGFRCTISTFVDENTPLASVSPLFAGATWQEREVWDLFGIFFTNNTDLRRILTDYGFTGHPLRKDFPVTGFVETYYDEKKKQIMFSPVSLAQEYRNYYNLNPWIKK